MSKASDRRTESLIGDDADGLYDAPYTIRESPAVLAWRSKGYDYAVFNRYGRLLWVDTKEECERRKERWEEVAAVMAMFDDPRERAAAGREFVNARLERERERAKQTKATQAARHE